MLLYLMLFVYFFFCKLVNYCECTRREKLSATNFVDISEHGYVMKNNLINKDKCIIKS